MNNIYIYKDGGCFPGGSDGKVLPAMLGTHDYSLGQEDPL